MAVKPSVFGYEEMKFYSPYALINFWEKKGEKKLK